MLSDPITLYKLMILDMLKKVKFPITGTQLSEFFLGHEYTTYFTLQQAVSELLEAHLIKAEYVNHSSRYEITDEGEDTLTFFGNKMSGAIVKDINDYLKENKVRMRNEVGILADYTRTHQQDYRVHGEIREGKSVLFEMSVSVPTMDQAEAMCAHFKRSCQDIYAYAMKELLREDK